MNWFLRFWRLQSRNFDLWQLRLIDTHAVYKKLYRHWLSGMKSEELSEIGQDMESIWVRHSKIFYLI